MRDARALSPTQVCDDFTEQVDGQPKELRLMRADLSIDCDGEEYKSFLSWPILMIFVFPIGVPLLYARESHRSHSVVRHPCCCTLTLCARVLRHVQ